MKILTAIMLFTLLSACSAVMPTRDIESKDANGSYPLIGAVPLSDPQMLSESERSKITSELTAARAANKAAAAQPLTP